MPLTPCDSEELVCYCCNSVEQFAPDGKREPIVYCLSAEACDSLAYAYSEETDEFSQPLPAVQRGQQLLNDAKFRRQEARRCCSRAFHQTCLGRRAEAANDRTLTVLSREREEGTGALLGKRKRIKDLRHRCCEPCLLSSRRSTATDFSGSFERES